MQVAAFAHFTGDEKLLNNARPLQDDPRAESDRARWKLSEELRRTKPYGYHCSISMRWHHRADSLDAGRHPGRSVQAGRTRMRRAMEYMVPFIRTRKSAQPPDV